MRVPARSTGWDPYSRKTRLDASMNTDARQVKNTIPFVKHRPSLWCPRRIASPPYLVWPLQPQKTGQTGHAAFARARDPPRPLFFGAHDPPQKPGHAWSFWACWNFIGVVDQGSVIHTSSNRFASPANGICWRWCTKPLTLSLTLSGHHRRSRQIISRLYTILILYLPSIFYPNKYIIWK